MSDASRRHVTFPALLSFLLRAMPLSLMKPWRKLLLVAAVCGFVGYVTVFVAPRRDMITQRGNSSRALHLAQNIGKAGTIVSSPKPVLTQLPHFSDGFLISCGLADAFSDYFRLIGPLLLSRPARDWHRFLPLESTLYRVPKHGAYICDLIKIKQELRRDKLVTIIGIFETTML